MWIQTLGQRAEGKREKSDLRLFSGLHRRLGSCCCTVYTDFSSGSSSACPTVISIDDIIWLDRP